MQPKGNRSRGYIIRLNSKVLALMEKRLLVDDKCTLSNYLWVK